MDGAILGPGSGDDWVDVLSGEGLCELVCTPESGELTFDFGGVGFGLQAFLTTFSKEDIYRMMSQDEPDSDSGVGGGDCVTFLLWHHVCERPN